MNWQKANALPSPVNKGTIVFLGIQFDVDNNFPAVSQIMQSRGLEIDAEGITCKAEAMAAVMELELQFARPLGTTHLSSAPELSLRDLQGRVFTVAQLAHIERRLASVK